MRYRPSLFFVCLSLFTGVALADSVKGNVNWADVRQLGLPVSGLVKQVNVNAGQVIEKGAVLLALDCAYYQARAKESTVLAEGLKPGLLRAEKDRDLANELFDRTVLSEVEHQEAQHKYIEIKSRYEAALARQSQSLWQQNNCNLIAADKLIVLGVKVSVGEMVNLNTSEPALVSVASAEKMSVSIDVKSPSKQSLVIGKALKITIANKQYAGRLAAVNYAVLAGSTGDTAGIQLTVIVDAFNPQWAGTETATVEF